MSEPEIGGAMLRRTFVKGTALAGVAPLVASEGKGADASMAERFAATLSVHDIAAFADLFAEDYVNHQVSAAAQAPSGVKPKAATVSFFQACLKAMPDLKVTIQTSVAEGDKVAASFAYEGTQLGPYYGFDPTGKRLFFTSCDIFRLADDRIVEHWGMSDIAGVVAQLRG
jgi:steroid delta-isomerase-like uncharacterized protein